MTLSFRQRVPPSFDTITTKKFEDKHRQCYFWLDLEMDETGNTEIAIHCSSKPKNMIGDIFTMDRLEKNFVYSVQGTIATFDSYQWKSSIDKPTNFAVVGATVHYSP